MFEHREKTSPQDPVQGPQPAPDPLSGLAPALADVDLAGLDADAALTVVLQARAVIAAATAVEAAATQRMLVAYPVPEGCTDEERNRMVAAELGAAIGGTAGSGHSRLAKSGALTALPHTLGLLRAGRLDPVAAPIVIEATRGLTDPVVLEAVDAGLAERVAAREEATGEPPSRRLFRSWCGRLVMSADPDSAATQAAAAEVQRDVGHDPGETGRGHLWLSGPVAQTAQCFAAIDALARSWAGDGSGRSLAQRRFDAAHHLLTSDAAGRTTVTSEAVIVLPLSTLVGADDAPGEIVGLGPVPAPVARELAAGAGVWWRLLTDPPGEPGLLTAPVRSYRPTTAMRRWVLARSGYTCAAYGCASTAGLQLDHVEPFDDGGETAASNLVPLCPRHHNAKTHEGWTHELDPSDGTLTQTTPLGRVYSTGAAEPPGPTGRRAGPPPKWLVRMVNKPPGEDPPAEDPPAEDPPGEDPPGDHRPAEDPPADDPPADGEAIGADPELGRSA